MSQVRIGRGLIIRQIISTDFVGVGARGVEVGGQGQLLYGPNDFACGSGRGSGGRAGSRLMRGLGRGTDGGRTLETFTPPSTSETLVLRTDRSVYLVAASATALLIFGTIPRSQVAGRSAATKNPSIFGK